MLRLALLVSLFTDRILTAHVTDRPPHINRFDKLYEKLEKLSNTPDRQLGPTPEEKLYEKLDELNSLSPERLDLIEEDEDLLSAMQTWISAEHMAGMVKDLQRIRDERRGVTKEMMDQEYGDMDDEDGDSDDYPMDGNEDWEPEDSGDTSAAATSKPLVLRMSPSAITRTSGGTSAKRSDENVIAAAEAIAATNTRPKITEILSDEEESSQRHMAMQSYLNLWRYGKCKEPQSRWLLIRQLAPAADTQYLPPCVQLHRCAPDAGCCINDSEVCAPVDGKIVSFPIALRKADGTFRASKMQFFNHTRCACVSREKLRHSTARVGKVSYSDVQDEEEPTKPEILPKPEQRSARREVGNERQNDWRAPTVEPTVKKDEEVTAPPQLRRCTCPALFFASMPANEPCACVCDWQNIMRRRDCQSLARGKENFGLRDRVCVAKGDCTQPSCEYGAYDVQVGKCPLRRYRRIRFHGRGRYQPEKPVVV